MKQQPKDAVMVNLLVVLIIAAASGPVRATMLIGPTTHNGSFESQAVAAGSYAIRSDGSPAVTDWTISGGKSIFQMNQYSAQSAADGQQWVTLQGINAGDSAFDAVSETVAQSFATTAGRPYAISFEYAVLASGGGRSWNLTVQVGNNLTFTTPTISEGALDSYQLSPWTLSTFTYIANTTGSTTLSFTGNNVSGGFFAAYGSVLDDVTVEAIPEPAAFTLLFIGSGLIWWRRRNR